MHQQPSPKPDRVDAVPHMIWSLVSTISTSHYYPRIIANRRINIIVLSGSYKFKQSGFFKRSWSLLMCFEIRAYDLNGPDFPYINWKFEICELIWVLVVYIKRWCLLMVFPSPIQTFLVTINMLWDSCIQFKWSGFSRYQLKVWNIRINMSASCIKRWCLLIVFPSPI